MTATEPPAPLANIDAPVYRGPTAAVVCAWGFLVAKAAAAVLDVAGGGGALVALAFVTGFLGDAVLVLALGALERALVRRGAARRFLVVVGAAAGLYACANVYLVAAYGSPLTRPMLAYAKDADTAVLAGAPLAAALASVALFAVLAWPCVLVARRLFTRVRARTAAAALAVLGVLGAVLPFADGDGAVRAFGLDRNALVLFVRSALPAHHDDARVAYDAPWPAPRDPRFTAPVHVDTSHGRPHHIVMWLAESTADRFVGKDVTPNLTRLQAHALRFSTYDANAPISAKAIFTTLCGLYPSPEAAFETRTNPRIACPSLMETLTQAGWSAALFHGGYFAFTDKLQFLEERGFDALVDGESTPNRDRYFNNGWGVDDQAIVDDGLTWLDAHQGPTLEIFIPLLPHYEYFMPPSAPKPFGDGSLLARYKNGVHYSDHLFGELVDAYDKRGLADDTLFVFVGDHGEAFQEHPRNKLHAGFLYEENVHAPLIIVSPRLFPQAETSDRLGSHVDLAATLLDLVGVPKPAGMQGQSLVSDAYAYRPILLATWYPNPLVGLRDGDRKYIRNLSSGVDELYDLRRDPHEKRNVAAAFPDVVAEYRARLADFVPRQKARIHDAPRLGPGFLERAFAALQVSVDGAPCARVGERIMCAGGAQLEVRPERVFNMDRRCLRFVPPEHGTLHVRVPLPVRTVGIGLTDRARFAHGPPLHASFDDVELVVNDVFETTSKVHTRKTAAPVDIDIRRERDGRENRAACLTLSP